MALADFFFGVAAFLGAAFLGAAFFAAGFAVVFVTRPDLVLPRTAGFSTTAGAAAAGVLRGLLAFAFGLAAGFLGAALVGAAFLGAAGLAAGGAAFFGAAFYMPSLRYWNHRTIVSTYLCGGLSSFWFLLRELHGSRWTLGLCEVAALDASLERPVELRVEDVAGGSSDLVVGLNIFLDGLTAAEKGVSNRRQRELQASFCMT